MKKPFPLAAALLLALTPALAANAGPAAQGQTLLKPYKTETPPVLDGKLDDPVWAAAPSVSDFETFIPEFGKKQPEKTVAYMAYDRENIYFAFRCFDDQPDKIKAAVSRRDDVMTDDFVCINLDSFNDQQSLYAFYVNPLGIQGDSRFASNKEDFSFDMVWWSAGRIDAQGYTVEIRIPLKSIRYAHADRVVMSIFFERAINRRQEHGSYPALDPKRGYAFLTQMAPMEYFGLKRYNLFELLPAFTYGSESVREGGSLRRGQDSHELSLTGKYGITPSLILDGTINPDFSQIEADAGQVDANLRYDLFYPEKRPFFLEGGENFNVGAVLTSPLQALVHTRTIVDPKAGFKLTGKIGRNDTIASIFAVDASPSSSTGISDAPDAWFSIFRYKRTTSQDGYLGVFYSERDQDGRVNRVLGPDGQIRINQSGMLSFHAFGSFTRAERDSGWSNGRALSLEYYHDSSTLGVDASFHDISSGFEADTGYLTRTGLTSAVVNIAPRFYPKSAWFRRVSVGLGLGALHDYDSGLTESSASIGTVAVLKGNSSVSAILLASNEVFLGRRFNTSGFTLTSRTQLSKMLSLTANFWTGKSIRYVADPYQGHGSRATLTATYRPSENINIYLAWQYSDLFKDATGEKVYDYNILRGRLTYQVNKYLFFRAILESNSYKKTLLADFLASFTYIPGTVIHVGYGSLYEKLSWVEGEYRESDRFLEMRRGFFFKASYLWRL
ncbi:MAG: DUF5916 domain-containing protein [Candidatus Aminicenantes bacterium]|nr:DUF5916 domain-containing protein [Candidatus Aminicenantes bacterium]